MARINLDNNYCVVVDRHNFTLCKRHITDGSETLKPMGYYSNMAAVLNGAVRLDIVTTDLSDMAMAVEELAANNERRCKALEKVVPAKKKTAIKTPTKTAPPAAEDDEIDF